MNDRKKLTVFEQSIAKTAAMRHEVRSELHPLFDHIMNLAIDSHARGYHKRAGIELLQARRLSKK